MLHRVAIAHQVLLTEILENLVMQLSLPQLIAFCFFILQKSHLFDFGKQCCKNLFTNVIQNQKQNNYYRRKQRPSWTYTKKLLLKCWVTKASWCCHSAKCFFTYKENLLLAMLDNDKKKHSATSFAKILKLSNILTWLICSMQLEWNLL